MTRTILVHLNVEVPDTDKRSPEMISDDILAAFEVGYKTSDEGPMTVESALADEV